MIHYSQIFKNTKVTINGLKNKNLNSKNPDPSKSDGKNKDYILEKSPEKNKSYHSILVLLIDIR